MRLILDADMERQHSALVHDWRRVIHCDTNLSHWSARSSHGRCRYLGLEWRLLAIILRELSHRLQLSASAGRTSSLSNSASAGHRDRYGRLPRQSRKARNRSISAHALAVGRRTLSAAS